MNNENSFDACNNDHASTTETAHVDQSVDQGFYGAYVRHAGRIAAFPATECAAINVDIPAMVKMIRAAIPGINALRSRLVTLAEFDIACLDDLDGLACAVSHLHAMYTAAATPVADLASINDAAIALRDLLHSDAAALKKRGLIPAGRLDRFKRSTGYDAVVNDLAGIGGLLREMWSQIAGRCATTMADIERADLLAMQLQTAAGAKQFSPAAVAASSLERSRGYTLLVRAYDQVRRAVHYLRWSEGDADQFAPSVYQGRGGRSKAGKYDATEPGTDTAPPGPAKTPSVPPAAPATVHTGAVGTPNSNPFV